MFLLVPAPPGSPGQTAVKQSLLYFVATLLQTDCTSAAAAGWRNTDWHYDWWPVKHLQ